jgi:hypothetical protein
MKKLKKGFDLFKTRTVNDEVSFDHLEKKIGFKIPPLFKLYHQTFKVDIQQKDFFYDLNGEKRLFLSQNYFELGLKNAGINKFVSYEVLVNYDELLNNYLKYNVPNDEINFFYERRLLPICNSDRYNRNGGGIGVGTQEGEVDKIILIKDASKNESLIIADNIFSFVKGMSSFVAWEDVDTNLLYKNWGEDFWRIRDEEKPI